MSANLVEFVRVAYDLALDRKSWVGRLLDLALPGIDDGFGAMAVLYEGSRPKKTAWAELAVRGTFEERPDEVALIRQAIGPAALQRILWHSGFATASQVLGRAGLRTNPGFRDHCFVHGYYDFLQVNAVDPSGVGLLFGAPIRDVRSVPRRDRATWAQLAAHLRAALRLRRSIGGRNELLRRAQAVFTPAGDVEHLEAPAGEALPRLAQAVRGRAQVLDRGDVSHLEAWTALVDGRWSLVEHYETPTRRYLVAVENHAEVRDPRALKPRERQIVALAARGLGNKQIAYELGLSASRVATWLASAQLKLGVRSRVELVLLVRQLAALPTA